VKTCGAIFFTDANVLLSRPFANRFPYSDSPNQIAGQRAEIFLPHRRFFFIVGA
jgi:hypothetical protein